MNERIRQLADHVRDHAPKLIQEAETSIFEAIEVARKNQEDEEKELILSIPISVKWNLDSNKIEVSVAVAVKHKYTHQGRLADPNQPELLDGEGKPIPERLAKPLNAIHAAIQSHSANVSFSIPGGKKTTDMLRRAADELSGKSGQLLAEVKEDESFGLPEEEGGAK